MMSRRRAGAWALAVLGIAGCDVTDRPSARAPGRDSAGIEIVESAAPKWGAGAGRRVAEQPTVDLAGPRGGPFGEVMTATRLSDGRLVVADGRPPVLRYFSAEGRWLYDVGSASEGRNALRSIFHLATGKADTVAVYDVAQLRVMLVDPNGGIAGFINVAPSLVPEGSNGFLPHGLAPDGRYLLQRDEIPFPFRGVAGEVRPDSTTLFWITREGSFSDSTGRLLAGEIFGFAVPSGRAEPLLVPLSRPFGGTLRVGMGPSLVWYGEGHRWEFRGVDGQGRVARILRLAKPPAPLTPALRDSFIARFRAQRAGADAGMVQRHFAQEIGRSPFPDTLPAFTDLFVGRDSTIWVQHAGLLEGRPGDASLTWTVIGEDGTWLQEITMPAGFRPTAAGKEWVLGLWRDEQGKVHVRLYPLVEG
jgi:hypothetical protein